MNNKFINLWESAIQRFTRGGFLVGDYINFIDDYKSCECYQHLGQELQDQIEDLIASGLHIRVLNIKDTQPGRYPGNIDTQNGNSVVLDIAADHGGGRYVGQYTIPCSMVQRIDYYPNVAPTIPDGLVRPNKTQIKPVEFKVENEEIERRTRKTHQKDKDEESDTMLPTKNVKIPTSVPKHAKSPSITSYTAKYLS